MPYPSRHSTHDVSTKFNVVLCMVDKITALDINTVKFNHLIPLDTTAKTINEHNLVYLSKYKINVCTSFGADGAKRRK